MSKFTFTCPNCKQQMETEEEWLGMQAECPFCKQIITIEKQRENPKTVLKAVNPNEKPCPFCGQMIKKEAVFCKFCKNGLGERPYSGKNISEKASFIKNQTNTYSSLTQSSNVVSGFSLYQYFVQAVTKKYFDYESRACRKEYWGVLLFVKLIQCLFSLIVFLLIQTAPQFLTLVLSLALIVELAVLTPFICVIARRLHDLGIKGNVLVPICFGICLLSIFSSLLGICGVNAGGFNIFVGLLSIIMGIFNIGIGCVKGQEGNNPFGSDPLKG